MVEIKLKGNNLQILLEENNSRFASSITSTQQPTIMSAFTKIPANSSRAQTITKSIAEYKAKNLGLLVMQDFYSYCALLNHGSMCQQNPFGSYHNTYYVYNSEGTSQQTAKRSQWLSGSDHRWVVQQVCYILSMVISN